MTITPEQRSPEWFKQRIGRVTGSRVGAILGLSPWQSRADVMRAMVREYHGAESEFTGNVATQHGTYHEDGATMDFTLETGIKVTPAPFIPYEDWLGASPDGFTSDGGVFECKCPYAKRNDEKPAFKALMEQPWYAAQCDIEAFVAGKEHIWFWQWTPNGGEAERADRNDAWLNENLPKLRQFHAEYLDAIKEPDEYLAHKRVEIDTPETAKMIREWDELAEQIERLTERKKDLLGEMVGIAGNKNALFGSRKLTLTSKAGAISYAKAIKELLPNADLEKWRGKPTEYWGLK